MVAQAAVNQQLTSKREPEEALLLVAAASASFSYRLQNFETDLRSSATRRRAENSSAKGLPIVAAFGVCAYVKHFHCLVSPRRRPAVVKRASSLECWIQAADEAGNGASIGCSRAVQENSNDGSWRQSHRSSKSSRASTIDQRKTAVQAEDAEHTD
jgi:hypothetical protein